jgi:putative nucleotidyltransferase with HDIG domain
MDDIDEFVKIARKAMVEHLRVEGGYGYEFYHCLRVMKLSKEIAESKELKKENLNKKCLLVGALFHDVGRVIDFDNHAKAGVEFVEKNLSHLLQGQELSVVLAIIRQHCEDEKEMIEARIVSDADCIDHVGVMDVWRMFHYSAFNKQDQEHTIEWFNENKEWLQNHLEKLIYRVSKKEMKERINSELKFMKEFEREVSCRLVTTDM